MNILVAGDLFISDKYKNKKLFNDSVVNIFKSADFSIVNLEAPITNDLTNNKIIKTGPHLQSSEETIIPFLEELEVDLVTLANNHILDYGAAGISDTFKYLETNEINYVGAGVNLKVASEPFSFYSDGVKTAILNFAENEWSSADEKRAGANPLNVIDNIRQIKLAKTNNDKVICIIHGGHEYYNLPSPRIVKQYRFYVENGADAIVGHHPHCIGGYEIYKGAPILYSLGNFTFTLNSDSNNWYNGLLVLLHIKKDCNISIKITAICQDKETFKTKIVEGREKNRILEEVKNYSQIISDNSELETSWNNFIISNKQSYLNVFNPIQLFRNKYIISGLSKLKIDRIFQKKNYYKSILNMIRCEAHRDASVSSIDDFISK